MANKLSALLGIPIILLVHLSALAAADPLYYICGNTGNYTAKSTYEHNLNKVLSILTSSGPVTGFAKTSIGKIPDRVQGLVLCRGDVDADQCRSCLATASEDLLQICPYDKAAMVWYDYCFSRFSNVQFLAPTDSNSNSLLLGNTANATDIGRFNKLRDMLLSAATDYAVGSPRKFATGVVSMFTSEFPTIYGLVQCTPDLSGEQCDKCLRPLFDPLPSFLAGRVGGRVIGDRCSMRYEVYSFFEGAPTVKLTAP